jgi:hypothetical protein
VTAAISTLQNLVPGMVANTVNGLRANQNTVQIDGITSRHRHPDASSG